MRNRWQAQWYKFSFWQVLLVPFSWLFRLLSLSRRMAYRAGIFKVWRAPVPVIVVGNLTVGGTGKTPLTLWMAHFLAARGYRPGIVSRGYGGRAPGARAVNASDAAAEVGDEPLLLARRSACPVWVGKIRPAAARGLLAAHPECDVLICDDGLQHHALARDVEIAVIGRDGLGNGLLLPAGPLREPASRLRSVDAVVTDAEHAAPGRFAMRLVGATFRNVLDNGRTAIAADLAGLNLHAVAGIGNPQRFFDSLKLLGLSFVSHPFPDHHPYQAGDLQFEGAQAILMTEKDAVKCAAFAQPHWWYLEVDAQVSEALGEHILNIIRS